MFNESNTIFDAFPQNLHGDIQIIHDTYLSQNLQIHPDTYEITIKKEIIKIPSRIYIDENIFENPTNLSNNQSEIISCLLTRHHNGFVREKYLKKIINSNNYWTKPFILQLIGEYVIEILEVIYQNLDQNNIQSLKELIEENPVFWNKTMSRVITYWDCYYRGVYKYKQDYVGYKIIKLLQKSKQTKK